MSEPTNNHYHLADVLVALWQTETEKGFEWGLQQVERILHRLRDEVIAVVAEGLWDGDSDSGQPDYDRIAELYDDAAGNVFPDLGEAS